MVLTLVGHSNAKDQTGFSRLKGAEPSNFHAFSLKTLYSAKISVLQPFHTIIRKKRPLYAAELFPKTRIMLIRVFGNSSATYKGRFLRIIV